MATICPKKLEEKDIQLRERGLGRGKRLVPIHVVKDGFVLERPQGS